MIAIARGTQEENKLKSIFKTHTKLLVDVTNALCHELNLAKKSGAKLRFEVYQPYLERPTQRGHITMRSEFGIEANVVRLAEQIVAQQDCRLNGIARFAIAHEAENLAAIELGLFKPTQF